MDEQRKRLIELLDDYGFDLELCFTCKRSRDDCLACKNDRLADYLLANGVIVPPCKVGDVVYYLGGIHRTLIKSAIVEQIIIDCNGISDLFVTTDNCSFENSFDIFFTSKEEAEAALAERQTKGKE